MTTSIFRHLVFGLGLLACGSGPTEDPQYAPCRGAECTPSSHDDPAAPSRERPRAPLDASAPEASTPPDARGSGGTGGALGDSAGPCGGCRVHVPPSYSSATPMRLLVALHGDEGRSMGVAGATGLAIDNWRAAADQAGFIVLALACPASLGCNGAWSDWLASERYQPSAASLAYLDAQVDAIEAKYNVLLAGEYLAGTSGGAYWLGYAAPARASRFAGVAFVAGGMPAYDVYKGCPSCKIPGYFLGGTSDFRTAGQMTDTADAFARCGQEVSFDKVQGDHGATIASLVTSKKAKAILDWFVAHPRACK
jgi:hypothetical protein